MDNRFLLQFFFLLSLSFGCLAEDLSLRIHGSNTIGAQLAPELIHAWLETKNYQSIKIEKEAERSSLQAKSPTGDKLLVEIEAKGSSTGFRALKNGQADLGMSSRRIKKQEIETLSSLGSMTSLESEHVIALDGIAVIVHPDNPINMLKKAEIRDIFSGKIKDWKEVGGAPGTIHLYARDNASGTFDVFRSLVLGKKTPLAKNTTTYTENAGLSAGVSGNQQGIGFVSLPFVLNAKALAISDGDAPPIQPSRFSVATEDYALSRRLYMYIPNNPANSLARDFIEYVQSDAAQKVIAKIGFVSQEIFFGDSGPGDQYPEEMRRFAQDAKRLSINMRFAEKTVFLDNKAKRDADRVHRFLEKNGKLDDGIQLFGFAENKTGGMASKSLSRSVRRADQVANYLRDKGISVVISRGYGNATPVASNETTLGQEKNRRVELWLEQK